MSINSQSPLSFLPQELIRLKRDGKTLSDHQISAFINGITNGDVSDAQASAFAMSVFFKSMTLNECVALTRSMRDSGRVMRWKNLSGPVLDKHSSGGVGDTVSLALAPLIAACGGYVPMISGRGLGHTGGTLDKMASITGYQIMPDHTRFEKVVREVGCAIIGQTDDLAPADRKLYAIRDVTSTVESVPLITASILSKKLAAGLQALIMDVKVGNGAFMPTMEAARPLATSLVKVANGSGLPIRAVLTDMSQPLAPYAGNAIEVQFAVDYLKGIIKAPRFHQVTVELCAHMLVVGRLVKTMEEGRRKTLAALESGRAAEIFAKMVAGMGGPIDFMQRSRHYLAHAPIIKPVFPETSGQITAIDTRTLGLCVVELGGGRTNAQASINPAVGLSLIMQQGQWCAPDTPLLHLHAADETTWEKVAHQIRKAFTISDINMMPYDPSRQASCILDVVRAQQTKQPATKQQTTQKEVQK